MKIDIDKLNLKAWFYIITILLAVGFAAYMGANVNVNVSLEARLNAVEKQLETEFNSSFYGLQKPVSYIISQVGSYTCMQNGTTGKLEDYSTNASYVIQSAVDSLPFSGGKIFVKAGVYVVDGIHVKNKQTTTYDTFEHIVLEGEGRFDTVIKLRDHAQGAVSDEPTFTHRAVILAEPYDSTGIRVTIRNLYIHGNNENQDYNVSGIIVRKSFAAVIEDNFVCFCSKYGIAAFEMPSTAKEVYIRRNRVSRLGLNGTTSPETDDPLDIVNIYCPRTDCEIVDNIAGGTYSEGTGIYAKTSNTVMRNWVWTNNIGIVMDGSDWQCSHNFIEQCAEMGIYVKYGGRSLISDNRIRLGTSGYTPSHGIYLNDAKYVTVSDNKIFTNNGFTMTYGILENGTSADYNTILGNYLHIHESGREITTPISWKGTHTTVWANEGYENFHVGASALVFNDTSTGEVKAIDEHGKIRYTGTNSSQVINNAINNLLTSARTHKEKIIVVGDYILTRAVEIPSYTIFELIGELKLEDYSDTWSGNKRPDLLHNADPTNGNDYIEIVGGVYDGNWANGNSWNITTDPWNFNGLNCLYFSRGRNLKIINVEARNAGTVGFHYDSSINVTIQNCKVINPYFHGTHAGHVGSPSEPNKNFEYENCYIEGPDSRPSPNPYRETDGHAICDGYDEGVNILSNIVVNGSYANGIGLSGTGDMRIVVDNCYVRDVGYRGIQAVGHNVIVTNNVVQNTSNLMYVPNSNVTSGYGIYVNEAQLGTVSGNVISINNAVGIKVSEACHNITICNNVVTQDTQSGNGIIAQGLDCIISNNIVRGFERSIGIYSSGGNGTFITGNTLTGATYWLYITQAGTSNLTITNNVVEGSLALGASSGHTIKHNFGFATENNGTATNLANGGTVLHGLAGTPTTVTLTCLNATYDGELVLVYWDKTNTDSTNISVDIYWVNGTAITDGAIDISWYTKYKP